MTSIKPEQITFIVHVENFVHTEISDFVKRAQNNLDPTLLEFSRIELLEKNKYVRVEELVKVEELLRRKHAKEVRLKSWQEVKKRAIAMS
ncbi:Hypothetical predicted protein [Olea europaea subsp. europaea]|uniref:Uncharacterized protein n=1 Tax=Olea europaea subsp. europaea TaxID=158383 RepID=A0A8S0PEX0_OLEEU|nr:Hypothetical predicted protein [Olea europaea subsp. europaea]